MEKTMNHKNLSFGILLLTLLFFSSGCALLLVGGGAAAGAGAVGYARGELKSVETADLTTSFSASKKALDDLGFFVTSGTHDAISAKLVARGSSDTKIEISLKQMSEKLTEVRIRVGTFGDEIISNTIHQKIKAHLGDKPAEEDKPVENKSVSSSLVK